MLAASGTIYDHSNAIFWELSGWEDDFSCNGSSIAMGVLPLWARLINLILIDMILINLAQSAKSPISHSTNGNTHDAWPLLYRIYYT